MGERPVTHSGLEVATGTNDVHLDGLAYYNLVYRQEVELHEGLEIDLYSNDDQFIVTGTLHYYDDQVEWYVTLDWNTLRENTEYQ